tara:strand:+ start:3099 stop:4637 length:1539 start_codon:yes stop_codon:yes gene_type:complete
MKVAKVREVLVKILSISTLLMLSTLARAEPQTIANKAALPNVILIAVDDMGFDTPASFGGVVKGLTPNIDALAVKGMSFRQAYNTSSRCGPSRGTMMTGQYQDVYNEKPGSSNTTVRKGVKTIPEYLAPLGYITGLFGKDSHYKPLKKYAFDHVSPMSGMGVGRSPSLYAANVSAFIKQAKKKGQPFFISTNTHDPHRPFAGQPQEIKSLKKRFKKELKHIKEKQPTMSADNITYVRPPEVTQYSGKNNKGPGYLPDLPEVRDEYGYYLNSAHRADKFVGAMIKVLEENNVLENTLVIFLSDNGIHVPFAKANVYLASVKTPFVVYWQGKTVAGTASNSLISTIDLVPTILDAVGLDIPKNLPGKSLLGLVSDPKKVHHSHVVATLNGVHGEHFEMRSIIDQEHIYIYNRFAHKGYKYYGGEFSGGLSLKGMQRAAKKDPAVKKRLDFLWQRAPEEIYDVNKDPSALNNLLAQDNAHKKLATYRQAMHALMKSIDDPYLADFEDLLDQSDAK